MTELIERLNALIAQGQPVSFGTFKVNRVERLPSGLNCLLHGVSGYPYFVENKTVGRLAHELRLRLLFEALSIEDVEEVGL